MKQSLFPESNARVLIIDDNESIHEDIRKVLESKGGSDESLMDLEADIFGEAEQHSEMIYEIDSAFQGQDGFELVKKAKQDGRPYAMAFVDMRMPPGWDGAETVKHIWEEDPDIEIVICTAYSDQSWSEVISNLTQSDKLIIIKKPFEIIEIQQITRALTTKWALHRELQDKLMNLEDEVQLRVKDLNHVNETLQQEIKERERMELELRHAQKLEAVGQLSAGIAHEINTPVQFVSDSVSFLNTAFGDLGKLIEAYRERYKLLAERCNDSDSVQQIEALEESLDFEYIAEEAPRAFGDSLEGLKRIASIVNAMKQFAHPASESAAVDLNQAIKTTLTVAGSEYKYVADVETDLDEDLPKVTCQLGDINQVILNLIVNAAHAISDSKGDSGEKGQITIKTSHKDGNAIISIGDNGTGVPQEVRDRIFDPFFTTKEVGRGSGQGLAISHNIVTSKHGGSLHFETEMNVGTTFFICLPIDGKKDISPAAIIPPPNPAADIEANSIN